MVIVALRAVSSDLGFVIEPVLAKEAVLRVKIAILTARIGKAVGFFAREAR